MSDPAKAPEVQAGQQNLTQSAEVHRNLMTSLYGSMSTHILEVFTAEELIGSPELAESFQLYLYSFRTDKTRCTKHKECNMLIALYTVTKMFKTEKDKVEKLEKEIDGLKKKIEELESCVTRDTNDANDIDRDEKNDNKRQRT